MTRIFCAIILAAVILPYWAGAHGLVADGHNEPLTVGDYIELGGITLASLGLILYSFRQWKKDKKK